MSRSPWMPATKRGRETMEANDRFKLFHVCVCTLVVDPRIPTCNGADVPNGLCIHFPRDTPNRFISRWQTITLLRLSERKNISPRFRGQLLHRDTACSLFSGKKSYRGRAETLPVPLREMLQTEGAKGWRRTVSYRWTKCLHQGT